MRKCARGKTVRHRVLLCVGGVSVLRCCLPNFVVVVFLLR